MVRFWALYPLEKWFHQRGIIFGLKIDIAFSAQERVSLQGKFLWVKPTSTYGTEPQKIQLFTLAIYLATKFFRLTGRV